MNVRRATAEEVPAVVALARESFAAAVAPLYGDDGKRTFMEFATPEAMLKRMSENYVTYVAYQDGDLLGMAHVRDGCHLAMLFVKPQAQRKGIGRSLVELAVAECTCDTVTVASSPNSEGAYLSFGFVRISDEHVDRGIRFIMMALNRKKPNQAPLGPAKGASMHLTRSDDLTLILQANLPQITARLSVLLPRAEFHHIGATAIPGAVTKGDVDVLLRVEPRDFASAVAVLRSHLSIKQPENWTEVFASFGDDSSYPFPLGVQLVVRDSEADIFLFLHEYFTSDATHLADYNRIKTESAPHGSEEYRKAKDRFLSSILASRPRNG